ncbi:MAG: hypothetical protein CSA31_00900 [Desulfobulbus propionicus]|nr:MAG: hypothetical protein CSA31_00900 [Desulfobulbus propionicus]
MNQFKQEWNEETAMKILQHPTVDSRLWAEAVEWLLVYGSPEIKDLLNQASGHATRKSFPDMRPVGYDKEGAPCYSLEQLAKALAISEEEAARIITEKEARHGTSHRIAGEDTSTLQ